MIQKKTLVTTLSGIVIGGLLLSGGLAFAGDAKDSVTDNIYGKVPFFGQFMGHQGEKGPGRGPGMGKGQFGGAGAKLSQENLGQLVREGVITQEKADEIKAYIDKTEKEMQARFEEMKNLTPEQRKDRKQQGLTQKSGTKFKGKQDLFTELVSNKILTQNQVDTIKAKLKELTQQQKQQELSETLKAVVAKDTMTQDQADKVLKQFKDAEKNRAELSQKMENMTLKEIRQYMQDGNGKPQNPMDQMVSDGVVTQEQADAVQKAMVEIAREKNQQRMSDGLKALVDKGTITREQADKILTAIESIQKEREALKDKMKSMTQEERRQYMETNKGNQDNRGNKPQDIMSKLVEDGTITKDQAKAIQEVVPMHAIINH